MLIRLVIGYKDPLSPVLLKVHVKPEYSKPVDKNVVLRFFLSYLLFCFIFWSQHWCIGIRLTLRNPLYLSVKKSSCLFSYGIRSPEPNILTFTVPL